MENAFILAINFRTCTLEMYQPAIRVIGQMKLS